jgi:ECF transporter S component (folate family)
MKKEKKTRGANVPLRITVALALLAAVSIICGKYLAIRGGDILRFSFENLPIILASVVFGPWLGALVAVVADLVGCVLVGYTVNPLVTLGGAAIAIAAGLVYRGLAHTRVKKSTNLVISTAIGHLVGSVLIKTYGLAAFYSMPLWELMLWRLLNYAIVGVLEAVLIVILLSNRAVDRTLEKFGKAGGSR